MTNEQPAFGRKRLTQAAARSCSAAALLVDCNSKLASSQLRCDGVKSKSTRCNAESRPPCDPLLSTRLRCPIKRLERVVRNVRIPHASTRMSTRPHPSRLELVVCHGPDVGPSGKGRAGGAI